MLSVLRRLDAEATTPDRLPKALYRNMPDQVDAVCYRHDDDGPAWYPPLMLGADTISSTIIGGETLKQALTLLGKLTPDAYSDYLQAFYRDGMSRFGESWGYADIVTTLIGLAGLLRPVRYLEIGVRRGRSAAAVASVAPACHFYLFDRWTADYAGMDNPGPSLVDAELDRMGHSGKRNFVNGNSHDTLPAFFEENPEIAFDLITVDGDHSPKGAARDLADVLPYLAIGGAVVFDDICHPKHPDLAMVWNELVADDPRFTAASYDGAGYGVGFALRRF